MHGSSLIFLDKIPFLYFSYEVQVEKDYQHKGLGSLMLGVLEELARRLIFV